jgi:uncharacterized protein YjgD (DUF1641 family)
MNNIKDMTNTEFLAHIMDHGSKHGALVQMVIMDCLQKGLNNYIHNKDAILEQAEADRKAGKFSFVNMEAWVACCEETKQRIEDKYNPTKELVN